MGGLLYANSGRTVKKFKGEYKAITSQNGGDFRNETIEYQPL